MALTPLPDPPQTSDPANFATKADALVAALAVMVAEINAGAIEYTGGIMTGLVTLNAGAALPAGQTLSGAGAINITGTIAAATGTTASLAQNATETMFAAEAYGTYLVTITGGSNDAWRGSFLVRSSQNDPIVSPVVAAQYVDCVFSGSNVQAKNIHASAMALKWSYIKFGG